jgi:DNA-binding winged helix-turn-helix (wHTH) protein/tetratricopeptide (TPR) repeat protein
MIYAFGPWELDTRVYELRHRGSVCPIEPQVFDVLAYLAANRDRVVSKEELLEKVWQERFVSETTLTSRLKAARRAVGDDGKSQSIIRTLHGRGYRFIADVRICESDTFLVPIKSTSASSPISRPPGFVGRDSELVRLDAALGLAMDAKRQIVFVAGEAGAGKTTLVETFLGRARSADILIGRGQCVEHRGSGEPYMPLLDALGRLCRDANGAHIIELLQQDAPSWLLQMPWLLSADDAAALTARTASGDRMLRELGMVIERITAETPLVLLIEDLHWSDSATLEAVDLLARQAHPARLLLLGTFRPSDVKASQHPAYAICQELRARGHCELLSLPLLAARELDDYLRSRMPGADFTSELASLLHARTSGNPLFVGNLVDSWIARGLIVQRDGAWALDASVQTLETDVPDSLQHLIEKHVAILDAEEQRMLETASVIGREFSIANVAATMALDEEEIERRCESFARDGRFLAAAGTELWGDGSITSRFTFTHDLYVDVLYQRIAEARRARIHQRAGLALEHAWHGRERERGAELALHFQRAHDPVRAVRYLDLAAEQAIARSAYREAVLHITAALALVRDGATELSLRARLAPALTATRGWADVEAEKNYHRACELARAAGEHALLSQLLYGMATMYEYRGEYRVAERIVMERIALDGEDASAVNTVESHELLACSMLHQGRYAETIAHGERALEVAAQQELPRDVYSALIVVQAHGWLSGGYVFTNRREEAVEQSRLAIALSQAKGDELARASALVQAAFVRFYHREPKACRKLAEEGLAIARERRFPFHVACARILLGWCFSHEDQHEEAIREVRAGIRMSISIGSKMDVPLFLAMLAECLSRAGDSVAAFDTLDEAFARVGRSRMFFYLPEIYRMSADLLRERGDHDSAETALERARAIAEEQESSLFADRIAMSSGG